MILVLVCTLEVWRRLVRRFAEGNVALRRALSVWLSVGTLLVNCTQGSGERRIVCGDVDRAGFAKVGGHLLSYLVYQKGGEEPRTRHE